MPHLLQHGGDPPRKQQHYVPRSPILFAHGSDHPRRTAPLPYEQRVFCGPEYSLPWSPSGASDLSQPSAMCPVRPLAQGRPLATSSSRAAHGSRSPCLPLPGSFPARRSPCAGRGRVLAWRAEQPGGLGLARFLRCAWVGRSVGGTDALAADRVGFSVISKDALTNLQDTIIFCTGPEKTQMVHLASKCSALDIPWHVRWKREAWRPSCRSGSTSLGTSLCCSGRRGWWLERSRTMPTGLSLLWWSAGWVSSWHPCRRGTNALLLGTACCPSRSWR